jgi:hypothetical protein
MFWASVQDPLQPKKKKMIRVQFSIGMKKEEV